MIRDSVFTMTRLVHNTKDLICSPGPNCPNILYLKVVGKCLQNDPTNDHQKGEGDVGLAELMRTVLFVKMATVYTMESETINKLSRLGIAQNLA
jgi:hypothetical protein